MSNQVPLAFVLQLGLDLLSVSGNIKIAHKQHVHKEVRIISVKAYSGETVITKLRAALRRGLPK